MIVAIIPARGGSKELKKEYKIILGQANYILFN